MAAIRAPNRVGMLTRCSSLHSSRRVQSLTPFVALPTRQSFATVSDPPVANRASIQAEKNVQSVSIDGLTTTVYPMASTSQPPRTVLTTVHSFPKMEPLRFAYYPTSHLYLPIRRDILHRAIVYEGDNTRQGTANTKWRGEVHGSGRKLYQQKGTGRARVGDKKSPIRRGGGVAFGPKPRDFSTDLPRKVYDLAWRTALSLRYKRGELVIVNKFSNPISTETSYTHSMFDNNRWGKADGKSLLIAEAENKNNRDLFTALELDYQDGDGPKLAGRIKLVEDIDVKNLLEMGRIIVEFRALNRILFEHSSDLLPDLVPVAPVDEAEDVTRTA